MNQTIIHEDLPEIRHYGVIGMKWGKTLHGYKTRRLEKKTRKVVRRFDKGISSKEDVSEISSKVRAQKYKMDAKVKRAEKYLAKAAKADLAEVTNRYNKDPQKRAAVKDYMETMKGHSVNLAEYRMQLMDARL